MKSRDINVKILLIQPITIFSSSFDFKNTLVTHLLEIGTQVKLKFKNNPRVSVEIINLIDEEIYKPTSILHYEKHIKSLESFLLQYNDNSNIIFGISCFSSNYYISSIVLAKIIRKMYPQSLICVGGYQVNYFPEEFVFPRVIEGKNCAMKLFDYIFLGESDYTFADIIEDRFNRNRLVSDEKDECHIIQSGLVENLETLPQIDYSLMKTPDSPFLFIPIYFSKGCPYNCTFCGDFRNSYEPKERWRMVSPKNALIRLNNLIKKFKDKSIQIQIFDPLWTYPKWRMQFYNSLKNNNISQEFWAEIRVDQFSMEETQYLKELNFTIAFGLESAASNMLRIMKKTQNPTHYLTRFKKILSDLDDAGTYVICNILLGHPGETHFSISQTMDYVYKIADKSSNLIPSVSKYLFIPGSDVFNNQSHYIQTFSSKFHYPHYWTIPKCSRISSSMVDPSSQMNYMDVITTMSQWIPDLYSERIKHFTKKNDRDFIYQRYLNQMIFGPRTYWKKKVFEDYNTYGDTKDVFGETEFFWRELY